MEQKRLDLTTGNPITQILRFSLPLVLGSLFQQFYSFSSQFFSGLLNLRWIVLRTDLLKGSRVTALFWSGTS